LKACTVPSLELLELLDRYLQENLKQIGAAIEQGNGRSDL